MGHHWTDGYSREELDAKFDRDMAQREAKEFADSNGFERWKEDLYAPPRLCPKCGAIVPLLSVRTHIAFHAQLGRVASDAAWGGLNRPIGGSTRPDGYYDTGEEGPPF